ncbi:MAG TPA: hypothetical protein DCL77_04805 [Prolixibacteraceae bacterium]|jgi:hypothetical protein|nr:hypothetical protein [Prolixibacteraceae bacterium]
MKKIIFWVISGFLLCNCQANNSNSNHSGVNGQEKTASNKLVVLAPKLTKSTIIYEIKKACEPIIDRIDSSLSKLKKVEKKLTIYAVPHTPVTIWYSEIDQPVKIECAVTDDSGVFTNTFKFYFLDGHLWYSDQIFARYLFDVDKLQFWMDENWKINDIPTVDFNNREASIKGIIAELLSK